MEAIRMSFSSHFIKSGDKNKALWKKNPTENSRNSTEVNNIVDSWVVQGLRDGNRDVLCNRREGIDSQRI